MWILQSKYGDKDFFSILQKELLSVIEGEQNLVANLANLSSWIYHSFPDLNWCGFYLWSDEDKELILGPFQGRPACLRIKPSRGVCGAAFEQGITLKVDNVHSFPGHIACDSQTQSELVIPLQKRNEIWGVLDLDSPLKSRFTQKDSDELTKIMNLISDQIFPDLI